MESDFTEITFDVQLQPGERLRLPEDAVTIVGPGHWLVSIRPADSGTANLPVRDHTAFLNSFASEDEGLSMTIQPGEFWVANIPFTNAAISKKRPILTLWLDGFDVVAAAVTTANLRSPFDVALIDWKAAGLRRASTVRLSRLDCLERS